MVNRIHEKFKQVMIAFSSNEAGRTIIVLSVLAMLFVIGLYPLLIIYWIILNPSSPWVLPLILFLIFYVVIFATQLRIEKQNPPS